MKKMILLFAITGLFLQTVKSETEPNDSAGQANVLLLNVSQTGGLTGGDLNDWFVLDVPQSGKLILTLGKTGGGNGTLYFRDGAIAGNPEITSLYISYWESPPEGWTISYSILPGKYYVQINKNTDPINYTLTATLTPSNYAEDLEPNNTLSQALDMSPVDTVNGNIRYYAAGTGADQEDWYKMVVPQAGMLKLTIHKKGPGNPWLYFKDGEMPGYPDISNFYFTLFESPAEGWTWSYPVLAGTYYFQISNSSDAADYQLISTLIPPAYPEDTEPNNNQADALIMAPNGTISGLLHYYGAGEAFDVQDWYKLTVPQGGILSLNIHKKGPGNTWLYFKDGEMASNPEVSNFYFSYWESPAEGWVWSYPVLPGNYYFQISGGENTVDYQMVSSLTLPQWGNDPEPNNETVLAQAFPVGGTMGGTIGYYRPNFGPDNWDWFKVVTTEYGQLSFIIHKKGLNNANLRLRDTSAEIATHYLGFGDLTTSFSKIVPAGTYYIGVEKLGGDLQYQLESSLLPVPVAGYTYQQTGNVFAFENTSLHEASYFWNFDDGTTATTVNAYHEYAEPGNFNVCLIATNIAGADTACQIISMPGVARVLPKEAGNTGDVTLQVFGGGLDTSYVAKIMNGGTVIATSNFTGFAGKSSIFVRFDLRNKPVGNYQLLVERSGGPSYTVPAGFKIVPGIAADPWVSINGRNRILYNTWTTYTVNYGNHGNVDARLVPVWFVFSNDPNLQVEFPNVQFNTPDTLVGEPESEGIYMETDSVFGQPFPARVYPFILPVIPAGAEASFKIRVKTGGNLKIKAWAEKPWRQSPLNEQKVECLADALAEAPPDLGLTQDKVLCMKTMSLIIFEREEELYDRDVWEGTITEAERPPFITLFLRVIRASSKICGISDPADRKRVSEWVTKVILNYWLSTQRTPALVEFQTDDRSGESCPIEFEPQNPTSTSLTAVSSLDPNEKSGPSGFGADNFLRDTRSFPYTIHFENVDTATAPAHTVVVTDQLNTAIFDLTTFSFDKVFIGDSVLFVEPGLREFVLDKKLNNLGVTARVHGKLDMQTGVITWTFRSLDAVTLDDIEDPDIGFLPPNVQAPEGQGAVSFFVKLKNVPQDGVQVKNSAGIVFDNNPAILTNEHLVTFDLAAPQSAILPIAPVQNTAQFELNWSGTDAGAGIQHYNIYYVLNNTDTVLWRGGITGTSALFTGEGSNTYEFFSRAVDNVGNVEEAPEFPDAVTTIITGTSNPVDQNADLVIFPNPVRDQLTIYNRSTSEGCLTITQVDGLIVAQLRVQPGNQLQWSVADRPQGVLMWRWSPDCNGAVQVGKVLVMR